MAFLLNYIPSVGPKTDLFGPLVLWAGGSPFRTEPLAPPYWTIQLRSSSTEQTALVGRFGSSGTHQTGDSCRPFLRHPATRPLSAALECRFPRA
jgi:hypothetical protein